MSDVELITLGEFEDRLMDINNGRLSKRELLDIILQNARAYQQAKDAKVLKEMIDWLKLQASIDDLPDHLCEQYKERIADLEDAAKGVIHENLNHSAYRVAYSVPATSKKKIRVQ